MCTHQREIAEAAPPEMDPFRMAYPNGVAACVMRQWRFAVQHDDMSAVPADGMGTKG